MAAPLALVVAEKLSAVAVSMALTVVQELPAEDVSMPLVRKRRCRPVLMSVFL